MPNKSLKRKNSKKGFSLISYVPYIWSNTTYKLFSVDFFLFFNKNWQNWLLTDILSVSTGILCSCTGFNGIFFMSSFVKKYVVFQIRFLSLRIYCVTQDQDIERSWPTTAVFFLLCVDMTLQVNIVFTHVRVNIS